MIKDTHALEKQDLSRTYLACRELESKFIIALIVVSCYDHYCQSQ